MPTTDRQPRQLRAAGLLFAVGSLIHMVDHLRRGQGSITDSLLWAGNFALVVQVTVITLIMTSHRTAPVAAVAGGLPLALGFLAAHWVPEWSALSDPVWEIESLPALSVLASSLEIAGALAIGIVGAKIVRQHGLAAFGSTSSDRSSIA